METERWFELVRQTRLRFPRVDFALFYDLLSKVRHANDFSVALETAFGLLEAEDELEQQNEEDRQAEAALMLEATLGGSDHRLLPVEVPAKIDREHAQAILVYGFIVPTQLRTFAGRSPLSATNIRRNVMRKFLNFEESRYEAALAFLVKSGALKAYDSGHEGVGYSLNLHEKEHGVTDQGRRNILAAKRLLYEQRSQ